MADNLTRAFRAQLTTAMDSVLRTAVFEITQIFENSLHDHQVELAHKGEEIAQLKIKLQRAEIRLGECVVGGDKGKKMSKNQNNEAQIVSEDAPKTLGPPPAVPEIDFEVPDDWCAPIGSETVTIQNDSCPSVGLRQLTIPLWHVAIKEEVVSPKMSEIPKKCGRKPKKASTSNETHRKTQARSLPQGRHTRPAEGNDMKHLLRDVTRELPDPSDAVGPRKRRNILFKQEDDKPSIMEGKTDAKTDSVSTNNANGNMYSCKYCSKLFNTQFGLRVHVQSHKRCKGCKKTFPFPSTLNQHKTLCPKFRKLVAARSANPDSNCSEETSPSEEPVIIEEKKGVSVEERIASSFQVVKSVRFSCKQCRRSFTNSSKFEEHMRLHTAERPFHCSMCTRNFRIVQALKLHMIRSHGRKKGCVEPSLDLSWMKPLDEPEDNQENVNSSSENMERATQSCVQRGKRRHKTPKSLKWQTMGTKCPEGFLCLRCNKVVKNANHLVEHYRIHTGEKPIKCNVCPATFSHRAYLYIHRKKQHQSAVFMCQPCGKFFTKENKYNIHLQCSHKNWPYACQVCGKGFATAGWLQKHMQHQHS